MRNDRAAANAALKLGRGKHAAAVSHFSCKLRTRFRERAAIAQAASSGNVTPIAQAKATALASAATKGWPVDP